MKTLLAAALMVAMLAASAARANGIEVQWLGHATARITTATGKVIVIDPFVTRNSRLPAQYRDLAAIGDVDLILVTHGHGDHVADMPALARLTGAPVVGPWDLMNNLVAFGVLPSNAVISMNKGGRVQPLGRDISIHMVPAEHSSSVDLRALGLHEPASSAPRHVAGAEAVGYVIELENGFTIYHSGDTGVFGDMKLIHEFFKPDLALVCIGGHYTMGPEGAAYAVRELIKPKAVIPIHFGTYPVINRTPEEFRAALGDAGDTMLVVAPGESVSF